jgi:hypothetical protein
MIMLDDLMIGSDNVTMEAQAKQVLMHLQP